ncbi:P-loop containing nucleoside triphosphate hydrolase [Pseudocohnilembus persalinus]|uniref:p-loop containing nucleoside triphosphate hydrolase n=1 Tax=Pseudocohnilembus persalinus TaxID=266149 RepID=A0A0V0R9R4_PSEPJ|nr:P-loop containing nucleoside triphosphate hydrolase [Pseudocohnilembus persalinus]|eukprot:KRX11233.1 P-loop containing nucleoside triphosphate hydrolase [Pseudocohnilembus persalinus]
MQDQSENKQNIYINFENLNQEQRSFFNANPEIQQQLNDFIQSVSQKQPGQFSQFGYNYFNLQKYTPLVLTGPSGAGKGTIIDFLLNYYPNKFELSVSLTTRKARQGELHGVHYYFVNHEEFEREVENKSFAEYCYVHGNYYGTHIGKLYEIANRRKVKQMKKNQATDSEEQIQKRLKNALNEVKRLKELPYYHEIVNDRLEETKNKFVSYINKMYSQVFEQQQKE